MACYQTCYSLWPLGPFYNTGCINKWQHFHFVAGQTGVLIYSTYSYIISPSEGLTRGRREEEKRRYTILIPYGEIFILSIWPIIDMHMQHSTRMPSSGQPREPWALLKGPQWNGRWWFFWPSWSRSQQTQTPHIYTCFLYTIQRFSFCKVPKNNEILKLRPCQTLTFRISWLYMEAVLK